MAPTQGAMVKRPRQFYDLVECWWDDAASMDGAWIEGVKVDPHMILSVGFLVYCKRDYVVIAQDLDGQRQHNGRTQIPRGMVKKIKVLRKKDADVN